MLPPPIRSTLRRFTMLQQSLAEFTGKCYRSPAGMVSKSTAPSKVVKSQGSIGVASDFGFRSPPLYWLQLEDGNGCEPGGGHFCVF